MQIPKHLVHQHPIDTQLPWVKSIRKALRTYFPLRKHTSKTY